QRFSIEIKDKSGNVSKVVLLENLSALGYTSGKIDSTKINGEDQHALAALVNPIDSKVNIYVNAITVTNISTLNLSAEFYLR
ncbi:hypothetical protein FDF03_19100, partial [Clostridium botulinum]|nr:hypothetical protein [Clostridium botulinum]